MKNGSKNFYIGVDSGGTKCRIVIVSDMGKILYESAFKSVHYSVSGAEVYSKTVSKNILSSVVKAGLNLKNCSGICFGIAGAREKSDREKLMQSIGLKLNFKKLIITTDAMTALFGAFEGKDGIILISGTGSVIYGLSNGKIIRVGGWGRIIGDEGSGYWIGKRALNLVTKEYDELNSRKEKRSLLSERLFQEFGITNRNVNEKIFHGKFEIPGLAPVVIDCASKKCRLSLKIINEAAEALASHIQTYLKVSKRKKLIEVAFIGSIIENKNILSDLLTKKINRMRTVKVVKRKHSPEYGAALLAINKPDILSKF